jgi:peptide/nickel transport system permease protein
MDADKPAASVLPQLSARRSVSSLALAPFAWVWKFCAAKRVAGFGLVVVVVVIVVAVVGPQMVPYSKDATFAVPNPKYDPNSIALEALSPSKLAILAGPSRDHPLGTDALGRDLLTRLVYGARLSVIVGIGASAFATVIGCSLGVVSGYSGGWVDLALQRVIDAMVAVPSLLLLLLLVQVGQPSIQLTVIALAVLGAGPVTRVIRSATLAIRGEAYVEAARAIGANHVRIMARHVTPNVVGPVLVVFSAAIGSNILAEAGLSFLNLGVPGPSWGRMIAEGRTFLDSKPLMSLAAGGAIAITVLGFNLLGDGLRDVLDPRQRGAR